MRIGIVGFSQCGKSTLFTALTAQRPDPASGLKGQVGVAKVKDERLDFLSQLFHPKRTVHATVEFLDTPGLIRGEHADNAHRLAVLRTADALLVVLVGFTGASDPAGELVSFREELLFADLAIVTGRIEKLEAAAKKPRPHAERERDEKELGELKIVLQRLERFESIRTAQFSDDVARIVRSFQLFSLKPELVIVNCSEDDVAQPVGPAVVSLCPHVLAAAVKLELDLEELPDDERTAFMKEMGVSELARDKIIRAAYDAAGLISFFTIDGDECRAWSLPRGGSALDAAAKVHTDIARGFIRAEVVAFEDLRRLGSMKEVKAKGLARLEGREHVIKDGDIVHFRFSV
jgi:GTP-binding protein YchF